MERVPIHIKVTKKIDFMFMRCFKHYQKSGDESYLDDMVDEQNKIMRNLIEIPKP